MTNDVNPTYRRASGTSHPFAPRTDRFSGTVLFGVRA